MNRWWGSVLATTLLITSSAWAMWGAGPGLMQGKPSIASSGGGGGGGGGPTTACAFGMPIPNTLIPQSAKNAYAGGGTPTCIFYIDFTTITPTQVNAWINCSGNTGSAPFLELDWGFSGSNAPCARQSLITDSGMQVMDLTYTTGDTANADIHYGLVQSVWTQPMGSMVLIREHVPAASYAGAPATSTGYWQPSGIFYSFSVPGSPGTNGVDYFESDCNPEPPTATGCTAAATIGAQYGDFNDLSSFGGTTPGHPFPTLDWSAGYHTMAALGTTNGSTVLSMCPYADGSFGSLTACALSPDPTVNQATARLTLNLPISGPETSGGTMRGNMDVYIQWMAILSCSTWATTACTGPTYTAPPAY